MQRRSVTGSLTEMCLYQGNTHISVELPVILLKGFGILVLGKLPTAFEHYSIFRGPLNALGYQKFLHRLGVQEVTS